MKFWRRRLCLSKYPTIFRQGRFLKKRTPSTVTLGKESLLKEVSRLRKKHSFQSFALCGCLLPLLPLGIFAIALLNAVGDYPTESLLLLAAVCVIGAILIGVVVKLIRKILVISNRLLKYQEALERLILQSAPLPQGDALRMYIDYGLGFPLRLILYPIPDSDDVYFIAERVDKHHQTQFCFRTEPFDSLEDALSDLPDGITEIPLPQDSSD